MSRNSSLELTLKPLSGNSNDLESAATIASPASDSDSNEKQKSRMLRTVLAVFLIVGTVAAVGICTAVFAPGKGRKDQIDEEVRVPSSVNEQDLVASEMLYRRVSSILCY